MAYDSRFFNSEAGDRVYDADEWDYFSQSIMTDGYAPDPDHLNDGLYVRQADPADMSVNVDTGHMWIDGKHFRVHTSAENLAVAASDADDRIDRAVVRLDRTTRTISPDVKTGTAGTSPSPPALQQDDSIWELSLAQIFVGAGVSSISDADITDERIASQPLQGSWDAAANNSPMVTEFSNSWTIPIRQSGGTFDLGPPGADRHPMRRVDVDEVMPIGAIIMWSGAITDIPERWSLCDGTNGTPNLLDRFVVGAGGAYTPDQTGGAQSVTLSGSQVPSHDHDTPNIGNGGPHDHILNAATTDDSNHTHVASTDNKFAAARPSAVAAYIQDSYSYIEDAGHDHDLGRTSAHGGDGSHENRPPYYALAYIMRTS